MSHFAEISGSNNIVTRVLVAEQDYINSIEGTWIQTSYNTYGGVHHCSEIKYVTEPVEAKDEVLYTEETLLLGDELKEVGDIMIPAVEAVEAVYVEGKSPEDVGKPDGGVALRKNFAGKGYTYDEDKDAFIPAKPEPSASIPYVLDEDSCRWILSGSES